MNNVTAITVQHTDKIVKAMLNSHSIDLDVFPGPHIPWILELHTGRETGLLSFFERLKISTVDVWT